MPYQGIFDQLVFAAARADRPEMERIFGLCKRTVSAWRDDGKSISLLRHSFRDAAIKALSGAGRPETWK
jgi:hypothetical protein